MPSSLPFNVRRPHPDEHLAISLPYYQHSEENRWAKIRHWEYHHPDGWLPGPVNWWLFPMSECAMIQAERNHVAMNRNLRAQGFDIYDTQEPEGDFDD
jgi:hypothetical protein